MLVITGEGQCQMGSPAGIGKFPFAGAAEIKDRYRRD